MSTKEQIKKDIERTHQQYWGTFSLSEQVAATTLRRHLDSAYPANPNRVTGPDARKNYIECGVSAYAKSNPVALTALKQFVDDNNITKTKTTKWTRYHIYRDSLPVSVQGRKPRSDRAFQSQATFEAAYDIAFDSSLTIKEKTVRIDQLLTKPLSEKVVGRLSLYAQGNGTRIVNEFYTWQAEYIKTHQKPKMTRDEKLEEITDYLATEPSLINRIYTAIFGK